jgi:hypothetical protein
MEIFEYVAQLSQKCMRCSRYIMGGESVILDPLYKSDFFYSHECCVNNSVKVSKTRLKQEDNNNDNNNDNNTVATITAFNKC